MLFMNEFDIEQAKRCAMYEEWDVMLTAVEVLERLVAWTNRNSDGWPYWPKPARAARQLMELIQDQERKSRRSTEQYDMTYNDRDRALTPIKSFLTRQRVDPDTKAWIIYGGERTHS